MRLLQIILLLFICASCKFEQSVEDKTCLEEPFNLLMSAERGSGAGGYEGLKKYKVYIWDEKDELFSKLRDLESTDDFKEARKKIFSVGSVDLVRVEGHIGDKARDLIRETTFYKTCFKFFEENNKNCKACKRPPLIHFRWNVSDFNNSFPGSAVDLRKFKEPEYVMNFND